MKEFMLLYKGGDPSWMENTSAEEMAASMDRWGAWMGKLEADEQLVSGGSPLSYSGVSLDKDGIVTDLASAEIKELVSGYSIIRAKNAEDATAIAKLCPIFEYPNITVEVREVMQIG